MICSNCGRTFEEGDYPFFYKQEEDGEIRYFCDDTDCVINWFCSSRSKCAFCGCEINFSEDEWHDHDGNVYCGLYHLLNAHNVKIIERKENKS